LEACWSARKPARSTGGSMTSSWVGRDCGLRRCRDGVYSGYYTNIVPRYSTHYTSFTKM
jgi:hypothetical protein